jgi:hypothetical protein
MRRVSLAGVAVVVAVVVATTTLTSVSFASNVGFERALFNPLSTPGPTILGSPGAFLDQQIGALTSQGMSPASAMRAIQVQSETARKNIVRNVAAGVGKAFGGAWFEPMAGQLHVGAVSPAGRKTAEGIVAGAGLSTDVTVTPVRSSMAELLAMQKRWDRRLARLFVREEVKTGIEPQRNAVNVTLSSSVPAPERVAIEHEAAVASANVVVTKSAGTYIDITPLAKTECKRWSRGEASCNPSLTAGVTLILATTPLCTAGPLAINSKQERVVLTAGHCIKAVGENWSATNKAGTLGQIGPVEQFVFGGAEGAKKGDYGDIRIESGWQTRNPSYPVLAVTAEWKKMNEKSEETSYPVKGEGTPVVNNTNCVVGRMSGETCGTIKMVNVTLAFKVGAEVKYLEGLVEDVGPNLIVEKGDSGGPWLTIEANQEALMEGTSTALAPECIEQEKEMSGGPFFKTRAECANIEFKELETNKGKWERKEYKCKEVVPVEKGAKFYGSETECKRLEKAGEGKWERTPELRVLWQPLKSVEGGPEGTLEALNLKLLTTANEFVPSKAALIWKVGGTKLEGFQTRGVTAATDGKNVDFHSTIAGVGVLLLSKEVEFEKGATLDGGKPGSGEAKIVLLGVTVDSPAGCLVETDTAKPEAGVIRTNLLESEIVESQETGEPLIRINPETGDAFAGLLLLDKGAEKCVTGTPILATLTGSVLARPLPLLAEALRQALDFEAPTKNFLLNNGTLDKAGLSLAGNPATLTGSLLLVLTTDEIFGAF